MHARRLSKALRRSLPVLALRLALVAAGGAFAEDPHATPAEAADHGGSPEGGHADGHGEAAHGGADAHGEGGTGTGDKVVVHAVNFVLFLALLGYVARRPVKDFLANRSLGVARELDESAKLRSDAQHTYSETEQRLADLDARLAEMVESARKECEMEGKRARTRAEEAAESIDETARRNVLDEADQARHELRRETADLAVALARDVLDRVVSAEDHQRIASSYLDRMAEES